jgi:hypothetical protein
MIKKKINMILSSMKRFTWKIFVFIIILFIAGCKKNNVISEKQTILFQFEYVNYAWGYQHNGFIIDNEGNILSYSNPEAWNFPDKNLSISEESISENLSKCLQTGKKIPAEELQKYSNYIRNIASSKVTAIKAIGADAGTSEYLCYQYSNETRAYKGSLIKMEGDLTCENLNFYSKKLATWMKDIHMSISEH